MRFAAVLLVVIGCPSVAFAQGKVDVRWQKNGIIRISQGRNVRRIDLGRDISGCIGEVFDRTVNERYGSGLHKMQVLDVTSRDGQHFVLASAVAAPNCNVQGMCGAADDNVTLIWLHLSSDLALVRKQSVPVEECPSRYAAGMPDDWSSNLKLIAGSLTLSFTEDEYDSARDKTQEFAGQVSYERQSAADGLRVTRVPK